MDLEQKLVTNESPEIDNIRMRRDSKLDKEGKMYGGLISPEQGVILEYQKMKGLEAIDEELAIDLDGVDMSKLRSLVYGRGYPFSKDLSKDLVEFLDGVFKKNEDKYRKRYGVIGDGSRNVMDIQYKDGKAILTVPNPGYTAGFQKQYDGSYKLVVSKPKPGQIVAQVVSKIEVPLPIEVAPLYTKNTGNADYK